MKKLSALLAALVVLSLPVSAQTKHPVLAVAFVQAQSGPTATVSWTQPTGLPSGTTVSLYRCAGPSCTSTTAFTLLVSGVTVNGPYVDSTVTAGQYSYYLVNVNGTQTSVPSSIASGTLPRPAPTSVTVTVN